MLPSQGSMLPLALATEVADGLQLMDGTDNELPPVKRGEGHLARLKDALLLYVKAKYVDHIRLYALQPELASLGISPRSVNGAWGLVRNALKQFALSSEEAVAVATGLIQGLTCVPRAEDVPALNAKAAALRAALLQPPHQPPCMMYDST